MYIYIHGIWALKNIHLEYRWTYFIITALKYVPQIWPSTATVLAKWYQWCPFTIFYHPWFRLAFHWWDIINSLWSSEAIWRHRSGSTLAQIMACCLTVPSHYLNQCWLIINEVQWQSPAGNFTRDTSLKLAWKFHLNLPGANELITLSEGDMPEFLALMQTWYKR